MGYYCGRQHVALPSIMFVFRGERIDLEQTPAELGLRDGDVIYTLVMDISMGSLITQLGSTSAMQQEHATWALGNLPIPKDSSPVTAGAIPQLFLLLSPTQEQCNQRQLQPWHQSPHKTPTFRPLPLAPSLAWFCFWGPTL